MARLKNCGRCNKPKRPKGKKFKELPGYCECGRPTVITEDVLVKLHDAFVIGLNNKKSCVYAGISIDALDLYEKRNPKFTQLKEDLRLRPDIKAQQTVVQSLQDPNHAWRWLERKDPDFKPASKVEHSGEVELVDRLEEVTPEEKAAMEVLKKAKKARRNKEIDNKDN